MKQEYEAALQHFQKLSTRSPDSVEGYLFQAAVLQTRAIDYREFRGKEQFDSLLALARVRAESIIDAQPQSPWGHYYLGTALGMESYDRIQRGEYVTGYFKGRSALSAIEKALEIDSTFYDSYSVLGTYYYWKSRKTEFLNWLPFFHDDRVKGIEYLRKAVEQGRYQRFVAMSNLLWIYLDAGDFGEAEQLARTALQSYPTHRIFLHGLAGALQNQGKWNESLEFFQRQLKAILDDTPPNDYNEIGCRINIVFVKVAMKDTTEIREHLAEVLAKEQKLFPPHLRAKVEEKFQQARAFEQRLVNGKISSE
ncbi:MAG: tetratricopeptide repeat protein [Bacteroidota bacterium]